MAIPNPAINPPVLSGRRSLHFRSPSRSPLRKYQPRDQDPILRDLSPTTTLRAFSANTRLPTGSQLQTIAKCAENVSVSEKALGIKAAEACLDLRSWTREVETWQWPGTFDVPGPNRKKLRMSYMSYGSLTSPAVEDQEEEEHWGSLPKAVVQQYEQRLNDIGDHVEQVNLEEMKRFVLDAHNQVNASGASIDDSIGAIVATTDLRKLDDFTAIVTATILQTLPYFSRLNHLLGIWTIRLRLLRSAPAFLNDLKEARTDLDHGWAAIAVSSTSTPGHSSAAFGRGNMIEMQSMIEHKVVSLGQRLDQFLDELEGREETVPDAWIDDFESLEVAYGDWVVQAERKALENEWLKAQSRRSSQANEGAVDKRVPKSSITNIAHAQTGVGSPTERLRENSRTSSPVDSSRRSSRAISAMEPAMVALSPLTESERQDTNFSSTRSPSLEISQSAHAFALGAPISLDREDSQTLPEHNLGQGLSTTTFKSASSRHSGSTMSPTKRHRHTPIVLHHDGDGQEYSPEAFATAMSFTDTNDTVQEPPTTDTPLYDPNARASSALSAENGSSQADVKKRAAFFNRNIETNNSLQMQSRSPVRSFEHASNAFTRLFQKNKTPEQNRDGSARSSLSSGSRTRSGSAKPAVGDGVLWGGRKPPSPMVLNAKSPSSNARGRSSSAGAWSATSPSQNLDVRPASEDAPDLPPLPEHLRKQREAQSPPVVRDVPEYYAPRQRSAHSRASRPSSSPKEPAFPDNWPLVSPEEPLPGSSALNGTGEAGRQQRSDHIDVIPRGSTDMLDEERPRTPEEEFATPDSSDGSPEIYSPRQPMGSDAFHSMFIDSFPPDEEIEQLSFELPHAKAEAESPARPRSRMSGNVPILSDDMLDPYPDMSPDPSIAKRKFVSPEASPDNSDRPVAPRSPEPESGDASVLDEVRTPESIHTEMSSPQVKEAIEMDYFQVSPVISRTSSHTAVNTQRHGATSPVSPMVMRSSERVSSESGASARPVASAMRPSPMKRASIASIGSFPRSELKQIDVNRTNSVGSTASGARTPRLSASGPNGLGSGRNTPTLTMNYRRASSNVMADLESGGRQTSSRLAYTGEVLPDIMQARDESTSPTLPDDLSVRSVTPDIGPDSPATDTDSIMPIAPLNIAMGKRRAMEHDPNVLMSGSDADAEQSEASAFEIPPTPDGPPPKSKARQSPLKPVAQDTFDRHVSRVLSSLPPTSSIRFKPRAGVRTPEPHLRTAEPRSYAGPRPRPPFVRAGTAQSMTVAPAEATLARRSKPSDPEVKLYHLTQAGRDEPIKLFVRLVGENERVMVRVGGGWQDLSEYLRSYAEHHPRRTVSEGLLEVNTDVPAVGGPGGCRVSGPVAVTADTGKPRTPAIAQGEAANSEKATSPTSPAPPISPAWKPLPGRVSNSRPTTPRPGSRQSIKDPESTGALNEQKARWVEGMIEKAKKASGSGEKNATGEDRAKYFGELGKVGSTRRIMFKGAKENGE